MQLDMDDLAIFMYNYAIVLTAIYATMLYGIDDQILILGIGFVFALFWTGYFRYSIQPRLVDDDGSDESDRTSADTEL